MRACGCNKSRDSMARVDADDVPRILILCACRRKEKQMWRMGLFLFLSLRVLDA